MTPERSPLSDRKPRRPPHAGRSRPSPEEELDTLVTTLARRRQEEAEHGPSAQPDPVRALRGLMTAELIPVFVELVEKYSSSGISLQMDASNFLEGGREIQFEFGIGDHRAQLLGTVTNEAIAFHETRHSPEVRGELVSGPMLRLRHLDAQVFRDFVCERITLLLRAVLRRR